MVLLPHLSQFFKKQDKKSNRCEDSCYIERMKCKLLLVLPIAFVLFASCSETKEKRSSKETIKARPFLFRMNYFLSPEAENPSFPLWFNDSLVRENGIYQLVQYSYLQNTEGEEALEMEKKFTFDERGELTTVQRKRYYENFIVEHVTFKYSGVKDILGFAVVEIIDSLHPENERIYDHYEKVTNGKKYTGYKSLATGDYLFYIGNMKLWNAVAVDSLLQPSSTDVIIYGSPEKPIKKFRVENIVNEKDVVIYNYFESSSAVKNIERENYPFSVRSTVSLNNKGYCSGYIDSTFSAEKYLNRTVSKFKFEENGLPVRLTHKGLRKGHYELFEYHYYE